MSYKIAVASSDEKQINETFGEAKRFIIYNVTDAGYRKLEERITSDFIESKAGVLESCEKQPGCENGIGSECGTGSGCGGNNKVSAKVELLEDCRCIVCKKIGFHIQKQLERKAISTFDVNCSVEEALDKISFYFNRIDNHESLRGIN